MTDPALALLDALQALLANPRHFSGRRWATTQTGRACSPHSPRAVAWNLAGGWLKLAWGPEGLEGSRRAYRALCAASAPTGDAQDVGTHEAALAVIGAARKALEGGSGAQEGRCGCLGGAQRPPGEGDDVRGQEKR